MIKLTADRFAEPNAITLVPRRRGGKVAVAAGGVRNLFGQTLSVVGKASAGEDHRAGANLQRAAVAT